MLYCATTGKIPIFVELRRFNDISDSDFITFIFHTAVQSQKQEARLLFTQAVEEGQFVFIFDGFDEVKEEKGVSKLLSLS